MAIKKNTYKDNDIQYTTNPPPFSRTITSNDEGGLVFTELYESPPIRTNTVDHKFSINPAQPIKEISSMSTVGASFYSLDPMFNYLSTQWEDKFTPLDTLQSPNIYIENTTGSPALKTFPTKRIERRTVNNYNEFMDKSFAIKAPPQINNIKNIILMDNILSKNSLKKDYPFYNFIVFSENTDTLVKDKLVDTGLFSLLIEDYVSQDLNAVAFGTEQLPTFDLLSWIDTSDFYISSDDKTIISGNRIQSSQSVSEINTNIFDGALKREEIRGFFAKLVEDKQRTVSQIANGQESYSETLFYKVDKKVKDTGALVQSYWIPSNEGRVELVDTQIKYGIEYEYVCHAYVMVIGASVSSTADGLAVSPSMQLIETPFFTDSCVLIQPPQPVPDIEFHNNKNIENEIKIVMKLNANVYKNTFVPLDPSETSQNDLVAKYNKNETKNYFHYETEHALFEIFRMDHQPRNYEQVAGFKIAEVKNPVSSITAVFKDNIVIDRDYYYVVRSINTHGLLSNPTPIYRVKQLKDANETFIESEVVGFFEDDDTQATLKFQKLLQLVPSSLHTIYDLNKESLLDSPSLKGKIDKVTLGIAEEPIWGKKFKLRITSTDSGKKMDLNVTVKLTTNKTSEDL